MTNKQKIAEINKWQESPYTHELTCGHDNCRGCLVPEERDGTVALVCYECRDYVQYPIPDFIYDVDYEKLSRPYEALKTLYALGTLKNTLTEIEQILKYCEQDRPSEVWRDACVVLDMATKTLKEIKSIESTK